MSEITLTVPGMTDDEAMAFAEFLKRAGFCDYRSLASNEQEAYDMRYAGEKIRKALADAGYAPR